MQWWDSQAFSMHLAHVVIIVCTASFACITQGSPRRGMAAPCMCGILCRRITALEW